MQLFDTHCHIQSLGRTDIGEEHTRRLWAKAGDLTAELLLENARNAGVTKMICVGCTLEDSELAIDFVQDKAMCWAAIGIHPHEAKEYLSAPEKLRKFRNLVGREKVAAVGECGLDYYYEHSPKVAQEKILRFQLELALEHDLPVIFHVRDAFDDFWKVYDEYTSAGKPIRGVIHSFSAHRKELDEILERDLYIGLNGIMTFTKDAQQLEAAKVVPLQKLLLETDAPFLTPTPYRGTICEPKHVLSTAEFLAALRGEDVEQIASASTQNAQELFGIT
jgi:TatD DNase family protein